MIFYLILKMLNKMDVIKYVTLFFYPIKLVLQRHPNSHVAYPGIPTENSNYTQKQYQHLVLYLPFSQITLIKAKQNYCSPERGLSTSITLKLRLAQPHWAIKSFSMETIYDII